MADSSRLADAMRERTNDMYVKELVSLDKLSDMPEGLGIHTANPGAETSYFLQFVQDGTIYRQLFTMEGELGTLLKVDKTMDELLKIEDLIAEGDIFGKYDWEHVQKDELPSDLWMKGLLRADNGNADWFESIRGELKKLSHSDIDWIDPDSIGFFHPGLKYESAAELAASQMRNHDMLANHGDEIGAAALGLAGAATIGAATVVASSVATGVAEGVAALGGLSKKWFEDKPAAPTKSELVEARSRTTGLVADDGVVFRGTSQASAADELSDCESDSTLTSKIKHFRQIVKMAHTNVGDVLRKP